MTWVYEQATGKLFDKDGKNVATGYAGGNCGKNPEGKNNPELQNHADIGPLPQGFYVIGPPQNTVTHGPYVLSLDPVPTNQMFGREGFLIHGDSVIAPGNASEGCIVLDRVARAQIWASQDLWIQVVDHRAS